MYHSKNKKDKKPSPYTLAYRWVTGDDTIELTEDILKNLNLVSFLEYNFNKFGYLTIYLNEYFNNLSTYSQDKMDFLKYLRYCYKLYHSSKQDGSTN